MEKLIKFLMDRLGISYIEIGFYKKSKIAIFDDCIFVNNHRINQEYANHAQWVKTAYIPDTD